MTGLVDRSRDAGPTLALVGPTAAGKTEASIPLARALGAEIVCVDSMLVYRGMDVGTAKPTRAERAAVPHHLVDVAEPSEPFSASRFQALAREAVGDIRARGRRALLVGGSGLYVRAVVDDLEFPPTEPGTRRLLETEALAVGPRALHRRLSALDPEAAGRIEPANLRRTVRALEVAAVTGRLFSSFARRWDRYSPSAAMAMGIEMPQRILHARIESRVARMMPGLLTETRTLLERGFRGFLTSTQAIGYAEAVACLDGALTGSEAALLTVRRTKALARRQMAWFRRDPRIRWFPVGEEGAVGALEDLLAYAFDRAAGNAVRAGRADHGPATRKVNG